MDNNYRHIAEELRREVEDVLHQCGVLFRVFARGKTNASLNAKVNKNPGKYSAAGKKIQDAIGVRVVLYFFEDTNIVEKLLSRKYSVDLASSMIDSPAVNEFAVKRHNLIFKIPSHLKNSMSQIIADSPIDTTFEIQIRSVLSEGWHEVDHDLRYKCPDHWSGQLDLHRALNGILATLETSEWSMKKIFDDLAYRHYKAQNWEAMLNSKFRMRVKPRLEQALLDVLNNNLEIPKELLRVNRTKVIEVFATSVPKIPLTLDNVLFVANLVGNKHPAILEATPNLLIESIPV